MLALHGLLRRFVDVCNAVAYAHSRGVLHRDIKPANIILSDDGEYGETFLVDWGLAKLLAPERPHTDDQDDLDHSIPSGFGVSMLAVSMPGSVSGTPAYMSPEQASGEPDEIGRPSDIYSLGATLYNLITGRAPFEDESQPVILRKVTAGEFIAPRLVRSDVPRPLEAVCLKAMALEPRHRYATPVALANDLEAWIADEPVSAWTEPWNQRSARSARRHRAWTVSTVVGLLIVSLTSVAAALLINNSRRNERIAHNAALFSSARGAWNMA